jgi:predicted TPR repeat methyltransferase
MRLAAGLAGQGKVAEAANIYQSILQQVPQHKEARAALGALQHAARSAAAGNPLQADMQQLIQLYESGQTEKTSQYASELVAKHPNQPLPHNILGAIHATQGNHSKAAAHFQRALDIAPEYVEVMGNLANALTQMQQHNEAIDCYQRYIEHRPEDADALFQLGELQMLTNDFKGAADSFERSISHRPMDTFEHLLKIEPANIQANFQIGNVYREQGRHGQAAAWYKSTLKLSPNFARAHSELGRSLLAQGKREEAIASLARARELSPDKALIQHFYNAALGHTDGQAPAAYVSDVFDEYAETFEDSLVNQLEYQTPTRLHAIWDRFLPGNPGADLAVDLGCGTGLVAEAFGPCSEKWTGIDLSSGMLDKARAKGIYDSLIQGELAEVLDSLQQQFDLFICCDTLVYIGDISPVFQAVARRSTAGAYFLFSTEHLGSGNVNLLPSGRYAHSKEYVVRCAEEAGFGLLHYELSELRKEHGKWLTGGYYILQYQGH